MRVAVFGCGSIGRRHAANLSSVPDVELMIHDVDRQQAETAGRQMSVPVARDLDEVWQWRPDAAVVATPPSDHVALAMEAVRRDCDVLVEKPLAHAPANTSCSWRSGSTRSRGSGCSRAMTCSF